ATKIVGDADLAQPVQVNGANGQPQVLDYIAWLRLTQDNFNRTAPVTANLQMINIASAGALKQHQGAATKFLPLLSTSSMADMLDDRFWVQVQNVLGQRVAVPSADNGALVMNAVENMMGSNDLISLRTRERSARPFLVVDRIRRDAESRFLKEEQALQQKVTATEASLRSVQTQNQQSQGGPPVLTKDQQAQIEKFRRDLVQSRSSLRQVQASLRQNVERLGTFLAFLN